MDARSLGLREDVRIWFTEGLRFVLCDQDIAARATAPAKSPVPQPFVPRRPQASSSPTPPAKPAYAAPRLPLAVPRPVPKPAPVIPVAADSGSALAVFPWDDFRPKLRVPSRIVWTYWELGQDFGSRPNGQRRKLFGTILKTLSWPARSMAFWPLSFENKGALIANKGSFLRGVRETGAKTIVCFGEKAFKVLFPRERYVQGRHEMSGMTVIVLPGPGAMLSGNVDAKRIVWNTLRTLTF